MAAVCAPSGGTANNWTGSANKASALLWTPRWENNQCSSERDAGINTANARERTCLVGLQRITKWGCDRKNIPPAPQMLWVILPKLGMDGSRSRTPRAASEAWKHDGCSPSPPRQTQGTSCAGETCAATWGLGLVCLHARFTCSTYEKSYLSSFLWTVNRSFQRDRRVGFKGPNPQASKFSRSL